MFVVKSSLYQSQSQSLFFEATPQDFPIKEGSQSHTSNKQNGQRATKKIEGWCKCHNLYQGKQAKRQNFGKYITGRKRLRELPRGQGHENELDDVNRAMCVLGDRHAQ